MKTLFTTIFQMVLLFVCAQKQDFQWPMGYDGDPTPGSQNFIMNFSENNLKFNFVDLGLDIDNTAACISSKDGILLFYSNGCQINSSDFSTIENGDSIVTPAYKEFCVNQGAYRRNDGAIFLNFPGRDSQFIYLQEGTKYVYQPSFKAWPAQLALSRVIQKTNIFESAIIEKEEVIISDTLTSGQVEAVKHANGRDWWIIQQRLNSNVYIISLLDATGIKLIKEVSIGPICSKLQGFMQSSFSPDGSMFSKTYDGKNAWLFDFDRCTGILSNYRNLEVIKTDTNFVLPALGLSFSPNSRFIYVSNAHFLFQYDTWTSNINSSRVEVAQYFPTQPYPKWFGRMELAPDGKIYMNMFNGVDEMHVINEPDEQGAACDFVRSAITLPLGWFNRGLPNQPNWRLGPIDGSSCDTLGIDNIPWAHWRWRADYFEPLKVHFRDLAGFEPTDWLWDFGDGQTSTEKSPIHDYASAGEYTVCCTVSNQFGQDSMCRLVKISTVLTQEPFFEKDIKAAPNPTSGPFKLYFSEPLERESLFELFDISGKTVFSKMVSKNAIAADFDFSSLGAGLFVWRLSSGGVFLANGKVAKIDP